MPSDALPFRRASLVEQTTQALRAALRSGALADPLPGEHALSARLGVSRPTLRAALAVLAREGILALAQGRRAQLTQRPARPADPGGPPMICVLSPLSRALIVPEQHPILLQLHARFADKGITWQEIFDQRLTAADPGTRLHQLVKQYPAACWIMLGATAAMQRWFARADLPCLVLGSCHEGVALPSVDINYRALGWHVAGVLLKHGHRQLALSLPLQPLAGDLACKAGLMDYLAQSATPATLVELHAREEPRELRLKLDRLLAQKPRPTALFCLRQTHALGSLLHFLETGRRIPQDISLIARDMHPLLEASMPDLAHYSRPTEQLVNRAVRLTQTLLSGRDVPAKPSLVTPVFMAGRTLSALSTSTLSAQPISRSAVQ